MTCIAFDGVTLAADKQSSCGNAKGTVTKIFRLFGELLGLTGDLSIGMEVMAWYKHGASPSSFPDSNRDQNAGACLIVVRSDRSVWKYESSPEPFRIEGVFCAFGSGEEAAMAAMTCGADARRAVEVASLYNAGCGNGVDALSFDDLLH